MTWVLACGGATRTETPPAPPAEVTPPPPSAPEQFTLTVQIEGHGTVAGGPIQCGSLCAARFNAGDVVTLVAAPEGDSTLGEWSAAGCSGAQCAVAVDRDLTIGVHFALRPPPPPPPPRPSGPRTLTVTMLNPDGTPFEGSAWSYVTIDAPGATLSTPSPSVAVAVAEAGTQVTLGFVSYHPYYNIIARRARWMGRCVATAAGDCALTLDRDTAITAVIEQRQIAIVYHLEHSAVGGKVLSNGVPPSASYYNYAYMVPADSLGVDILEPGQTVLVTAVPGPRAHPGQWTGLCSGPAFIPCRITATPDNRGGSVGVRFDPDVDPRYRIRAVVPLPYVAGMKGGRVVGSIAWGGPAATWDVASGVTVPLMVTGNALAPRAINRRGDVVGRTDNHPFVAHADGSWTILSLAGEFKAVSDAGLMAGNLDTGGTGWSDPATAQAFTFDGAAVTQLGIAGFTVNAINSTGVIAGAVAGRGALFHDGQLSAAGPGPLSALNSAGVAAGAFAAYQQSSVFLWDGSEHDLPGLWVANDIDDTGAVAGALDSGGRCTGRAHCDYQPRLHAALASGGIVEDLNFLVDTSMDPALVWHELSSAVALDDGGRVLVVFDNGMSAVLEPALPR